MEINTNSFKFEVWLTRIIVVGMTVMVGIAAHVAQSSDEPVDPKVNELLEAVQLCFDNDDLDATQVDACTLRVLAARHIDVEEVRTSAPVLFGVTVYDGDEEPIE